MAGKEAHNSSISASVNLSLTGAASSVSTSNTITSCTLAGTLVLRVRNTPREERVIPPSGYAGFTHLDAPTATRRSHSASTMSGSTSIMVRAVTERHQSRRQLAREIRRTVEKGVQRRAEHIIRPYSVRMASLDSSPMPMSIFSAEWPLAFVTDGRHQSRLAGLIEKERKSAKR